MKFRILGPLEVIDSHGAIALQGAKPRALLTVLLLHANKPVSPDRLAVALWGEDAAPSAVKTLHVYVSRLRKALGDEDILVTTPAGYRLRVGPGELDTEQFESLVADGRQALAAGRPERAAAQLREALGLWRGPPLEDLAHDPFARSEITRLEEERSAALEARVQADLAAGRHGELLGELRQLVAASPVRERLAGHLMLALYRCGRQSEALDVYARTRETLSGEFGLEPGPELRELQRDVLEQAASLELREPPAPELLSGGDPALPFALPAVLVTAADEEAFVGRAADLDALAAVYADAAGGRRRLVLVHGEPGIGKTRLAAEFARRAHEEGAIVLYGRCDEEALLAQQPFLEALRHFVTTCPPQELPARLQNASGELRRIMPELADRLPDLPAPLTGDSEGARSRLFEAVAALLCEVAQREPVVLVLDDLHWADKGTVLLLKYLARYPREARLMVLGTYRDTDVGTDDPLVAMLTELGREHHLERHSLESLDPAAVAELVGVHAGSEASAELCQTVYEGTEGNAFFVVEVLRHLAESGAVGEAQFGAAAEGLEVPDSVKDVIAQRIARLGKEANRLLAAAAVLGHEFELQVLERLAILPEDELVDALDAAVRASVIEEIAGPAGRYTFSHALIRDTVYGKLTATRRAILHRRAGSAIEEVHARDLEPHLGGLAHHYAQAGLSGDLDKTIEYGRRAGEHAITQLAYEQAVVHFRRTVELIDAIEGGRRQGLRCDLIIAQGEAERQAGDPAYRWTLLAAARLAQDVDDPERLARAALANNRGISSSGQGMDRDRVTVLRAALEAYDRADSATRAALLALLAVELSTDHDLSLHNALCDEAVAMARRIGDPYALARVLMQSRVSQWSPTQTQAERRANLREAAELADQLNDPLLAGQIAYLAANAAMNVGDLEDSDRQVARLGAVTEQLAQPVLRWYDGMARAKRCVISGPAAEAERLAYAALAIGCQTGQPDSSMWFLGQVLAARFLQGTLDRGDPHLPDLVPNPGSSLPVGPEITPSSALPQLVGAAMSLILSEVGRLDDARAHFELLMRTGLDDLPPNYTALVIPVYASVACARLGDTRRAERLHEILEPERDRLVTTGAAWFGATTHYLGLLAATLGRLDEADERFDAAERTYTSLQAEPWLARLRNDRIAAHLAAPSTGVRRRPDALVEYDDPKRLAER